MERREFLKILYEGLPDKSYIRTGCSIKDIKHSDDGIEVTMADGSVEKGDMVLGCDGVYSKTRSIMWDHADKISPGLITDSEKTCKPPIPFPFPFSFLGFWLIEGSCNPSAFQTQWKCLIGVTAPKPDAITESDMTVVHNSGYSFLLLAQPTATFFFVLFHLDKPIQGRVRYTNDEAEKLAATLADHPITETLKFGELWEERRRGALIPLEEGVLEHWHSGRIALAGDAVHKVKLRSPVYFVHAGTTIN